jgi:hypothetical protein
LKRDVGGRGNCQSISRDDADEVYIYIESAHYERQCFFQSDSHIYEYLPICRSNADESRRITLAEVFDDQAASHPGIWSWKYIDQVGIALA